MNSDSDDERKVQLRVSNQKAYVWDVDDIGTLRAKHHICGVLTGTLPHLSQQNVFLGIPLVLLPEEVVLLMEKEAAVLVHDPDAYRSPTARDLRDWNLGREVSAQLQIAGAEAKDAVDKAAQFSGTDEAVRKRKEREEKRAAAARAKAIAEGASPDDVFVAPPPPTEAALPRSETPSRTAAATFSVTVPVGSTSLAWYTPKKATYATLDAAHTAGVWTYPATEFERAKCRVYRDLWEQGNYMGGGIKFGGDFLVYPGDPLRYHSHFTASVIESPKAPLWPMEIVAHGRLGTATKKAHLFCEWDEETERVTYFSVEWAGFG